MAKLTKSFIDRVKFPEKEYVIHWDDAVSGYGLRVTPTGKRVFMVMGRVKGKLVQFTIGNYGIFTEDQARKRAQRLLQQMRDGIDPRDIQKEDEGVTAKHYLRTSRLQYLLPETQRCRPACKIDPV